MGKIIDNSNDINKISSKTQLFSKTEELLESDIFSKESSFNDDEDFESSMIPTKKEESSFESKSYEAKKPKSKWKIFSKKPSAPTSKFVSFDDKDF